MPTIRLKIVCGKRLCCKGKRVRAGAGCPFLLRTSGFLSTSGEEYFCHIFSTGDGLDSAEALCVSKRGPPERHPECLKAGKGARKNVLLAPVLVPVVGGEEEEEEEEA